MMTITPKAVSRFLSALWVQLCLIAPAMAQTPLVLPDPIMEQFSETQAFGQYNMPLDIWKNAALKTRTITGELHKSAWKLPQSLLEINQFAAPILRQLQNMGFNTLLDCQSAECGGFDFRFATDVIDPPFMYVDTTRYRFIALQKDEQIKTLLFSKSGNELFLQIIEAGGRILIDTTNLPSAQTNTEMPPKDVDTALRQNGFAILSGLAFDSGSEALGRGPFESLISLAEFLQTEKEVNIILVGHTDNKGSFEINLALSKRRAQAVAGYLADEFGIDPTRIIVHGVAYLSPVASNNSEAGQRQNKRVEVVLQR
jgi:outer membrane protein OmpA-like peptidoglycan-associated protein